jgi:hypothetical protein
MKDGFSRGELRHFKIIQGLVSNSFPKACSCGREFTDELDYTLNTTPIEGCRL